MLELDKDKAYRLVNVLDHEGNSKVESRDLYPWLIGCVGTHIRKSAEYDGGKFFVRVDFVQNEDGQWTNRNLRTSPVLDIREENGCLLIVTMNSVYVFEPAQIKPPEYRDEAELIELYLSNDGAQFCKGFYYDADKTPHELDCSVHLGMFQDSCLIYPVGDFGNFVCRYFPRRWGVAFYDTLYHQQDYSTRMLIHNVGTEPLVVKFEYYGKMWTIQPDREKYIMPYQSDGADADTN